MTNEEFKKMILKSGKSTLWWATAMGFVNRGTIQKKMKGDIIITKRDEMILKSISLARKSQKK